MKPTVQEVGEQDQHGPDQSQGEQDRQRQDTHAPGSDQVAQSERGNGQRHHAARFGVPGDAQQEHWSEPHGRLHRHLAAGERHQNRR